jgi:Spy/CpxP family protein refolding chaperone
MKNETRLRSSRMILTVVLLLVGAWVQASAQSSATQSPVEPVESQVNQANQANQVPDLRPLNLTVEQVQKIRDIYAEMNDQRQAATLKVRRARRALADALESTTPNQPLIEQRSRELADAQADNIRLRSLIETRIQREVLTPEQRVRVREMRRNQALRRQNQQLPDNGLRPRQPGLQRNANTQPGLTPNQRKVLRRQQRP